MFVGPARVPRKSTSRTIPTSAGVGSILGSNLAPALDLCPSGLGSDDSGPSTVSEFRQALFLYQLRST